MELVSCPDVIRVIVLVLFRATSIFWRLDSRVFGSYVVVPVPNEKYMLTFNSRE